MLGFGPLAETALGDIYDSSEAQSVTLPILTNTQTFYSLTGYPFWPVRFPLLTNEQTFYALEAFHKSGPWFAVNQTDVDWTPGNSGVGTWTETTPTDVTWTGL